MKYKTLLFDVDDTLLDFQATQAWALTQLFGELGIELTTEMRARYHIVNQQLWSDFEQGQLSRKELTDTRFGLFFSQLGMTVDSLALDKSYRNYLKQGHHLLGNSQQIITDLARKADLYVVTNGGTTTQYQRLKDAQLLPYFQDIFVSEATGYQKPMKEYFEYVFARIPNFNPQETVIIGDSLVSDIQGGNAAGIATIWLNNASQKTTAIEPTYQICKLDEIYEILSG
ncbi:MAG: YjjG family noncanonical pyrimidine nucleotidase [Enterococcus sp.]